jgi:hypothetical protein
MRAITFDMPLQTRWPRLLNVLGRLLARFEAFVSHRVDRAISESELHQIGRDIDRYRGLMHRTAAPQAWSKSVCGSPNHA